MKKFVSILIFIALIIIGILNVLPNFINLDIHKTNIINNIKKDTGRNLLVNGKMKLSLLPYPEITIHNIEFSNIEHAKAPYMIKAESLSITFNSISFYLGDYKINGVNLFNADINLEVIDDNTRNWDFVHNVSNKDNNVNIDDIKFINSDFNLVYSSGLKKTIKDVSLEINKTRFNDYKILATQTSYSNKVEFSSTIDVAHAPYKTNFTLTSDLYNIKGAGFVNKEDKNFKFQGKYDVNILKHSIFTDPIFATFPFVPKIINPNLQSEINLSGNIDISEKGFSSNDLKISALETTGNGAISLIIDKDPHFDLKLRIDSLNCDKLLIANAEGAQVSSNADNNNLDVMSSQNASIQSFINLNNQDNLDINIDTEISSLTLGGKFVKDTNINFSIKNNFLLVNKIETKFPDEFNISVSNSKSVVVDGENVFIGDIKINGEKLDENIKWLGITDALNVGPNLNKFDFSSELILAPTEITLLNIKAELGNGFVKGRWTTKNIEKNITNHDLDIQIGDLDLSYISFPKFQQFIDKLINNTNNKGYLADYKWFREIEGVTRCKIALTNSKYQDVNLNNFKAIIVLEPGQVGFFDASIDSTIAKFSNLEFALDARSLKPNLRLNLIGDEFDISKMKDIFYGTYNINKDLVVPVKAAVVKDKWSSDKFNLFRFDKFNGIIDFDVKNIIWNELSIDRLVLNTTFKDNLLYINNLKSDIFDGDLDIKGNLAMVSDEPSLSISVSFSDFDIKRLLKLLTNNENISGKLSISGSFYTKGDSPKKWASNINIYAPFAGREMIINGVDLQTIVDIASKRQHFDTIEVVNKINTSFASGSSIINSIDGIFSSADGKMQMQNTNFQTYYSNGAIAGSFDLANWLMNSIVTWNFLPKENMQPIVTYFNVAGGIDNYKINVKQDALQSYITKTFIAKSPSQIKLEEDQSENDAQKKKKNSEYIYQQIE